MALKSPSSKQLLFLLALALLVVPNTAAMAIQGGKSAEGSPFVVGLDIRLSANTGQRCTGGLVAEQIVVTAGHCVVNNGVPIDADSIRIYAPGERVGNPLDIKLMKVFFPDSYLHKSNNSEPNDIAFLVFDRKIGEPKISKLADFETAKKIIDAKILITLYGYGVTAKGEGASPVAKSMNLDPIEQIGLVGFAGFEKTYLNYAQTSLAAACSGDSGGPAVAEYLGSIYLVSVHSASSGICSTSSSEVDSNWGTIPGEYSDLYAKALAIAPSVLVKPEPSPSPSAVNPAETPVVVITPIPSPKSVKKTIYCLKGKVTKKVTALKPKCPAGFKKKS